MWHSVDLYLDLVVRTGVGVDLEDADELAIAVRDGLLDATSADRAVRRAVRAVDGLAAHGYDLHRWLTTHGMELTWQRR